MKQTLPKTSISLGWVSFFMDIASEMVYPIMPLFLVGALVSSIFAGWLWDHISSAAPFWFGGGAALVALALLPFIARHPSLHQKTAKPSA